MVSTISLAEKDDSEAYDRVLQIGHLVGSNRGQLELHRKSFKKWLWWKAPKNKVKTKIQRRVKFFLQIANLLFRNGI